MLFTQAITAVKALIGSSPLKSSSIVSPTSVAEVVRVLEAADLPLLAGQEAAAAPAPQAGRGYRRDHLIRRKGGRNAPPEGLVAVAAQVLVVHHENAPHAASGMLTLVGVTPGIFDNASHSG